MSPEIKKTAKANARVGWIVGAAAVAMLGAAYAAVPLYAAFCKATGFGGATRVAAGESPLRGKRTLSVRFDANVAPGLPWSFAPETTAVSVRTGAATTVFFKVKNRSNEATSAVAAYNVTPPVAGEWFEKISCFCFNEQHLGPGESAEWPVVFFLDPKLEQDHTMDQVESITLSYTLLAPAHSTRPPVAAVQGAQTPRL